VLSDHASALLRTIEIEKAGVQPAFLFGQFPRRSRSSRVQETNPMEPAKAGNLTHRLSFSRRAMPTREEIFND
jgi:hypothetical protein